jgi:flagellin
MRELAVQASTDTNTDEDRAEIQKEVDQLIAEIDRIGDTTEFNTKKLLNGGLSSEAIIRELAYDVDFGASGLSDLKLDRHSQLAAGNYKLSVVNQSKTLVSGTVDPHNTGIENISIAADTALDEGAYYINIEKTIEASSVIASGANIIGYRYYKAIETVSAERSKLGAMQNRLEHTIKNLDTSAENLQAAESRIRDVDMAKEMMEFTKQNILMQAATAMLAQANMAPQTVLKLLG